MDLSALKGIAWAGALLTLALALPPAGAAENPECRCRAEGHTYALGSVVVLSLPGAPVRCARCVMSANVTAWEMLDEGCPIARSEPPPGGGDQRSTRQSL